jgi:hypothetical protein
MFPFSQLSRRVLVVATFALLPFTGAIYFAQAQNTPEERAVVERALSAQRSELRGGRSYDDGTFRSPDGSLVVIDLGERSYNGYKVRSQVVYDFAAKKVHMLRLKPDTNSIDIGSETFR